MELAAARVQCRIEMLAVVPELGSAENLSKLYAEIEQTASLHYVTLVDGLRRHHAATGSPEAVFNAQRAQLERHSQSVAAEAVASAKRKMDIAVAAKQWELPSGAGISGSAAAVPQVAVDQQRHFHFIADPDLKVVLERDYQEIQRAFTAGCWKSVIILSGGAIEAILLDLLQRNSAVAKESTRAPNQTDLTRWDLKDLIAVSVDCKLVSDSVEKLSSPVREYRNLIHPGNEVRNKLKFGKEEARIACEVLNIVHRELV
jgi:hypothetical protein